MGKPGIAFFDFTSCEGCQLTVLDALQDHPELLDVVEIVQFREAMTEREDSYQIAFIEGACTRPGDEARLKAIREGADIVVALGACAHLGGQLPPKRGHVEKTTLRQEFPFDFIGTEGVIGIGVQENGSILRLVQDDQTNPAPLVSPYPPGIHFSRFQGTHQEIAILVPPHLADKCRIESHSRKGKDRIRS